MDWLGIIYLYSFVTIVCAGTFRFANHYGDHMVLQRKPSRAVIWGFGETGAKVKLSLLKTYTTHVTRDSRGLSVWKIVLDPIAAGGPYRINAELTSNGKIAKITLKDVFFGDVWICGGQSNMQLPVITAFNGKEELDVAHKYPKIRLFTVKRYTSKLPVPELSEKNILQKWSLPTSLSGYAWRYFSAVCWIYGRGLYDTYKIPIGLISTNYWGTMIEAWSSPKALAECRITENRTCLESRNMPSGLWNAMIYPFLNTTIYGVIWYQGEDNAPDPQSYNCTFPALITSWRKEWFVGTAGNTNYNFPFGFVQLSVAGDDYEAAGFSTIRWKQTAEYGFVPNTKMLNTFMAVAMDLFDPYSPIGSVHPRDKTTVAERLLAASRAIAYNESIDWTGPIVGRVEVVVFRVEKVKLVVVFYTPSSLQSERIEVRNNSGFEVMFENSSEWKPVDIVDQTDSTVSLLIDNFENMIAGVRYAWDPIPCLYKQCAIYTANKDLPGPPFVKYGPFQTTNIR